MIGECGLCTQRQDVLNFDAPRVGLSTGLVAEGWLFADVGWVLAQILVDAFVEVEATQVLMRGASERQQQRGRVL